MIPRTEVPEALLALAARQAGAVSRAQTRVGGLSDDVIARLIREGRWRRTAQGVYATSADTWLQRVWTGVLAAGPGAVVGLRAAARLGGLPLEAPRTGRPEPPIEIYVGRGRHPGRHGPAWRLIRDDREGTSSPPRTSRARTIVDLARLLDADELAGLVGQAVVRNYLSARAIRQALDATPRHPHRALLTDIVADAADGVASALERRYVHDVERAHGLPRAEHQASPEGLYGVDNLYRAQALIVECDSAAYHRGVASATDMERDRYHASWGYVTLRFTWADVADDPCGTARVVADRLRERGWASRMRACRHCVENSSASMPRNAPHKPSAGARV